MWIPCQELAPQAVFVTHFRKLIAAQFLTSLQLKANWHTLTDFQNSMIPETGYNTNKYEIHCNTEGAQFFKYLHYWEKHQ